MRGRRKNQKEKLLEIPNSSFFDALTWTCHICKEKRPDSKISVLTKPVEELSSMTGSTVTENIRYCNDRLECIEGAVTYTHFHLHGPTECCDRPKTRGPNTEGKMVCPLHCSKCGHDRVYEDYLGFCSDCGANGPCSMKENLK